MALGTDLGIIGTGLAAGGFFLGMGWKADDLISKQAREDLSEYLRHFKAPNIIKTTNLWPVVFREFFDRIFGEKHFSFKCFLRSSAASFISFCICAVIVILLVENSLSEGEPNLVLNSLKKHSSLYLGLFICLNLVVDYLSLLETRYVIGRIERTSSAVKQMGWVLLDFLVTGLLFLLFTIVALPLGLHLLCLREKDLAVCSAVATQLMVLSRFIF